MKTNKFKLFSIIALFLIGIVALTSLVSAASVPVNVEKVEINGDEFDVDGNELRGDIVRDDELEIKVKLLAIGDDENLVVKVEIDGLDHDEDEAEAETDAFTIKDGRTYYKTLNIKLPQRMDADQYALRIEVSNKRDDKVVVMAMLDVTTPRDAMKIKDVVFSPEGAVKAGRALLTTVRLKNLGERDQDDVKVMVSIPELGISASDYLDEVEAEDSVTSEELYMRIPECAEAKDYTVEVTVEFDEGDEVVSTQETITVIENEVCNIPTTSQTIITVGSDVQTVVAGETGVVYPLSLSNTGSTSKTYQISANAGDWASVKVSPSVAVVGAGETRMVYVYVSANEGATAGEQTFSVEVNSGDELLKEVVLKADVAENSASGWDGLKKGLEVGLVVLVVLLVIIGLIVGFSRLKSNDEDETSEEKYY